MSCIGFERESPWTKHRSLKRVTDSSSGAAHGGQVDGYGLSECPRILSTRHIQRNESRQQGTEVDFFRAWFMAPGESASCMCAMLGR